MISPLLLRSSRWVSFRVIRLSVARVLHSEPAADSRWQAAYGTGRKSAEERAASRQPRQSALEHLDRQVALAHVAHRQRREGAIRRQVSAQEDRVGFDASLAQGPLEDARRQVHHGERVAHERKGGANDLEVRRLLANGELTDLTARGSRMVGQVRGQPFLELARGGGGDEGGTRARRSHVDQQRRTVGLRARTGQRGSGGQ
jgi:hypothetical protein